MSEEIKPLDLEGRNIYKKLKVDFGSRRTKTIYDEKEAVKEIKQRIKKACEFYLRYKDNPKLLFKEKKLKHLFIKEEKLQPFMAQMIKNRYLKQYNEWLFKLAFKDVLEEGERK